MDSHPKNQRLNALFNKGGMMFFTIEKPKRLYKGIVLLSAIDESNYREKTMCIKEYRYKAFLK